MASVNASRVGPAAYTLIDKLQGHTAEEQVAGYAVAFLMVCQKMRTHPGNALAVAQRIIDTAAENVPEIRAMRMYADKEL